MQTVSAKETGRVCQSGHCFVLFPAVALFTVKHGVVGTLANTAAAMFFVDGLGLVARALPGVVPCLT